MVTALPGLLAACLFVSGMPAASAVETAPAVAGAAIMTEDALFATRWHIATYLYLNSRGRYDRTVMETNLDFASRLGFNAARFNVWWHEIYPNAEVVKNGGQWEGMDHAVDYAISKGMKVILTLSLRVRPQNVFFGPEDCVVDSKGKVDSNWDRTTRMSFSSPRFGRAIRFVQQVGERYKGQQNAGHILAIAPLVTREAEIAYAHDLMEDYNPYFVREFRSWLEGRYDRQIAKLNAAWGTQHFSFGEIQPPNTFTTPAGRDWYHFRDLKARQFVDSCAAVLGPIPGLTRPYRMMLDYGNVADPMASKRGSLSFAFHAENPMVWAVKHNDAHDYDQAFSGSLLGSAMQKMNKFAINEWFYDMAPAKYPHGDVIADSVREIKDHFDQGMNAVSYVMTQKDNRGMEPIIEKLKADGVWTAPVTPRNPKKGSAIHLKLSEIIGFEKWEIKKRYFDPQIKAGHQHVEILIDYDFTAPLLPVIPPMEYGQ